MSQDNPDIQKIISASVIEGSVCSIDLSQPQPGIDFVEDATPEDLGASVSKISKP